ncbi:MAG TPA: hypothetical protein VFA49_12065 [Chloroflexota bacterium]|nr:hypothetical protein [Chloroflexota bacterium]
MPSRRGFILLGVRALGVTGLLAAADHDRPRRCAGTALRAEGGSAPFHPPNPADAGSALSGRLGDNARVQGE